MTTSSSPIRRIAVAVFVSVLISVATAAGASPQRDWPQWLGPQGNGTAPAAQVVGEKVGLKVLWRRPLEGAQSSVSVVGGRAFTLVNDGHSELAVAIDVIEGRELWRTPLQPASPIALVWDGPFSTPAASPSRVVALTSTCLLVGLRAEDGTVVWRHDLVETFQAQPRYYGCATSPVFLPAAADELVALAVGGQKGNQIMAFSTDSGDVAWSAEGLPATLYATPVVATLQGHRQLVVRHLGGSSSSGLYGLDLESRQVLWRHGPEEGSAFESPVVLAGSRILTTTWSGARLAAVSAGKQGLEARTVWQTRELMAEYKPGLVVEHEGHLFGFGKEHLVCVDASNGTTRWREKIYPGSLILAGDHLVVLSQHAGHLRIVQATAAAYRERARLEIFEPGVPCSSPPSFADGSIFMRNLEELIRVAVE